MLLLYVRIFVRLHDLREVRVSFIHWALLLVSARSTWIEWNVLFVCTLLHFMSFLLLLWSDVCISKYRLALASDLFAALFNSVFFSSCFLIRQVLRCVVTQPPPTFSFFRLISFCSHLHVCLSRKLFFLHSLKLHGSNVIELWWISKHWMSVGANTSSAVSVERFNYIVLFAHTLWEGNAMCQQSKSKQHV